MDVDVYIALSLHLSDNTFWCAREGMGLGFQGCSEAHADPYDPCHTRTPRDFRFASIKQQAEKAQRSKSIFMKE